MKINDELKKKMDLKYKKKSLTGTHPHGKRRHFSGPKSFSLLHFCLLFPPKGPATALRHPVLGGRRWLHPGRQSLRRRQDARTLPGEIPPSRRDSCRLPRRRHWRRFAVRHHSEASDDQVRSSEGRRGPVWTEEVFLFWIEKTKITSEWEGKILGVETSSVYSRVLLSLGRELTKYTLYRKYRNE